MNSRLSNQQEGWVNYFDLNKMDQENPIFRFRAHSGSSSLIFLPFCGSCYMEDSVSVTAFHPSRPVLMTVSGSRRFSTPQSASSEEEEEAVDMSHSEDESAASGDSMEEARREVVVPRARITIPESKMKLWRA